MRIRIFAPCIIASLVVLSPMSSFSAPAKAEEKAAAIVVDANTGKTLHARFADAHRYPASLTKMMTLYVLFEELDARRLTLDSRLTVSKHAAAQAPSKLGIRAGRTIRVEDAIQALTTKSANDVAVVIAEGVSGSVSAFAARMNRTARSIGMNSSTFRNPNGLPDPGQKTTARDMARLGQALQDRYPAYYKYFGVKTFAFNGKRMRNHNRLLGSVEGVDGIKTGYTRASGFNLVTSVNRDGRHLIAVVMGGKTGASRDAEMRKLIARYLPAAKKGVASPSAVVAEAIEESQADKIEVTFDIRLPRPRPGLNADNLAMGYADAPPPRDLVSAAMAEPAMAAPPADRTSDAPAGDPVAERIRSASTVAEQASGAMGSRRGRTVLARLTEIAQIRAGHGDMIAGRPLAAPARAAISGGSAWNIQVGAVPTVEGAMALLEKTKDSMGPVLAEREPLTQEVEANGTTLYRARFAGFEGKEDARAACAKLKSKSISCLAVQS